MPLPFGHSLMGVALNDSLAPAERNNNWKTLILLVIAANLPDIDFLPGLIVGEPNRFHHHYFSHSLGFAIGVGLIFGYYCSRSLSGSFRVYASIFALACFSHLVLDALTVDTREPFGVPMFWPLSQEYVSFPVKIFRAVEKSNQTSTWIQSLFVPQNLFVALRELVIMIPVVILVRVLKSKWGVSVRYADDRS